MGSGPFMQMVETKETRAHFISHSIGFLRDRNFDGLDLDWEYPSGVYKDKFTLLVQVGIQLGGPRSNHEIS